MSSVRKSTAVLEPFIIEARRTTRVKKHILNFLETINITVEYCDGKVVLEVHSSFFDLKCRTDKLL